MADSGAKRRHRVRPDATNDPRVRAFCALFEAEFGHCLAPAALERSEAVAPLAEPAHERAQELVAGVESQRRELDELIRATAARRPLDQMALVDLIVLRIALWEMLFNNGRVRPNTAVRQAVELAKRFGSDGSRRLVSGVLGTISRTHLAADAPAPPLAAVAESETETRADARSG